MLLRFLVQFLLLAIILVGGAWFGANWKLNKELKKLAASTKPLVEIEYESAKLNLSGEIVVNGIKFYSAIMPESVELARLKYSEGGFYRILKRLFFSKNTTSELPGTINITLERLLIPIDNQILKSAINAQYKPTAFDLFQAAYCGENKNISLNELIAMGYSYLSISAEFNYRLDKYTGSAILNGFYDISDMGKVEYQVNIGNVMAAMESYKTRAIGEAQKPNVIPDIELLDIRYKDAGYNRRKAEYCAIRQGVSAEDYYAQHPQAVEGLLNAVDITVTDGLKAAYSEYIQPESATHIFMQPRASFDFAAIGNYDSEYILQQTNLEITVNEKPVKTFFENWSNEKLQNILSVGSSSSDQQGMGDKHQVEKIVIKKTYHPIALSEASRHVNNYVKVIRKDGIEYAGRISKTANNTLWIIVTKDSGSITLPISYSQIKTIMAQKNTKVKQEY